jgi:putative FmdB family regulatory protein
MPLYEYTCRDCEHAFETLVFDGDEVACPQCQGHRLQRQLSVPSRPRVEDRSLPVDCDPDLPPCGPGCCRLPQE